MAIQLDFFALRAELVQQLRRLFGIALPGAGDAAEALDLLSFADVHQTQAPAVFLLLEQGIVSDFADG